MHRYSSGEEMWGFMMEFAKIVPPPAGGEGAFSNQADSLREKLGTALRIVDQMAGAPAMDQPRRQPSERDVRAILKMRRNRALFFRAELFADPAWDILLELYAAELGQRRIFVTRLCRGAAVPATTAMRWIGQMEAQGLIDRREDPLDRRRQFLTLSNKGVEAMDAYFETVPPAASVI